MSLHTTCVVWRQIKYCARFNIFWVGKKEVMLKYPHKKWFIKRNFHGHVLSNESCFFIKIINKFHHPFFFSFFPVWLTWIIWNMTSCIDRHFGHCPVQQSHMYGLYIDYLVINEPSTIGKWHYIIYRDSDCTSSKKKTLTREYVK